MLADTDRQPSDDLGQPAARPRESEWAGAAAAPGLDGDADDSATSRTHNPMQMPQIPWQPVADGHAHHLGSSSTMHAHFQPAPRILQQVGNMATAPLFFLPPGDPRFAVVCGNDKNISVYDMASPSADGRVVLTTNAVIWSAAASADGTLLAVGDTAGLLQIFDTALLFATGSTRLESHSQRRAEAMQAASISATAFSTDSRMLFATHVNGPVMVFDGCQEMELRAVRTLNFLSGTSPIAGATLSCASSGSGQIVAACGGGYRDTRHDADSRRVQVWLLNENSIGSVNEHTLDFDATANAVAIRGDGAHVAVGTRDGVVHVYDTSSWTALMRWTECSVDNTTVNSLGYSPDGTRLAVGRSGSNLGSTTPDGYTVYHCATTAIIGHFVHPGSGAPALTFSPRGDILAVSQGDGQRSSYCLHCLKPPSSYRSLSLTPTEKGAAPPVISGASSTRAGDIVALTSGSRLELWGPIILLQKDFECELATNYKGKSPVSLRPDGKQVAVVLQTLSVNVLMTVGGEEAFCCGPWAVGEKVFDMQFSPDSTLLAACGRFGVALHSTDSGIELRRLGYQTYVPISFSFDASSSLIITTNVSAVATIWNVSSGDVTPMSSSTVNAGVAIDFTAKQIIVCVWNKEIFVQSLDDGAILQRFDGITQTGGICFKFSPDGQHVLCTGAEMQVLCLTTGADAEWTKLFRSMALPLDGDLTGVALGWGQHETDNESLLLHGAVGAQFVIADVHAVRRAIEDDAWTVEQLVYVSEHYPEMIVECAPHCVNFRDEAGDSLVHHLARTGQADAIQAWLSNGARVTPMKNAEGQTATMIAIEQHDASIIQALWSRLVTPLNFATGALVAEELRHLSKHGSSSLVRTCLLDMEHIAFETLATFRADLVRAEVVGLPTPSLPLDETGGLEMGENTVPKIWRGRLPSDRQNALCATKVLLVPYILGSAEDSPFHSIVVKTLIP
jgi:WD40 repeat protein